MPDKANPFRCLLEVKVLPIQAYRLPRDGRRWAQACLSRRAVCQALASFANADGSSIFPSIETLYQEIGLSERLIKYRLDDLEELGFLINYKQNRRGTKNRAMNRAKIRAAKQCNEEESKNATSIQTVQRSDSKNAVNEVKDGNEQAKECTEGLQRMQSPLHTTAFQPNLPPSLPATKTAGQDGGQEFPLNLEAWKAQLPERFRLAPWYKQKKRAVAFLRKEGAPMATAIVTEADQKRPWIGVDQIWLLFLNEYESFRQGALENTFEGQREAERRAEAAEEAAIALARKNNPPAFGIGPAAPEEESAEETLAMLKKANEQA